MYCITLFSLEIEESIAILERDVPFGVCRDFHPERFHHIKTGKLYDATEENL